MRIWKIRASLAILGALAACSSGAPTYPQSIEYGDLKLSRDNTWTRGQISGAAYVEPGEKIPAADLQVGVIVSSEHKTVIELYYWLGNQFQQSSPLVLYDSATVDESCRVGKVGLSTPRERDFIALQVCKLGVNNVICAEADERIDSETMESCISNDRCFEIECEKGWETHREPLVNLIAQVVEGR